MQKWSKNKIKLLIKLKMIKKIELETNQNKKKKLLK